MFIVNNTGWIDGNMQHIFKKMIDFRLLK